MRFTGLPSTLYGTEPESSREARFQFFAHVLQGNLSHDYLSGHVEQTAEQYPALLGSLSEENVGSVLPKSVDEELGGSPIFPERPKFRLYFSQALERCTLSPRKGYGAERRHVPKVVAGEVALPLPERRGMNHASARIPAHRIGLNHSVGVDGASDVRRQLGRTIRAHAPVAI